MARTVLMSGATGALGPHLLAELLRSPEIDRVFVVIRPGPEGIQNRARSVEAAVSRIARERNASPPARRGRLSLCRGGEATGYVHRFGAVHHALHWLMRGLIPMIPGAPESSIDVIANDVAARWIARAAVTRVDGLDVCHVAAGPGAP